MCLKQKYLIIKHQSLQFFSNILKKSIILSLPSLLSTLSSLAPTVICRISTDDFRCRILPCTLSSLLLTSCAKSAWDFLTLPRVLVSFILYYKTKHAHRTCFVLWRRTWDSNPRGCYTLLPFQGSSLATRSILQIFGCFVNRIQIYHISWLGSRFYCFSFKEKYSTEVFTRCLNYIFTNILLLILAFHLHPKLLYVLQAYFLNLLALPEFLRLFFHLPL